MPEKGPRYRVRVINLQEKRPVDWERLRRMAILTLEDQESDPVRLNVVVMDDAMMARINERHLHHAGPTDVISFHYEQPLNGVNGEILVSIETAEREARERRIEPDEELLRYVAHGVLHFLGYRDEDPGDRKQMLEHQERLVRRFRGK